MKLAISNIGWAPADSPAVFAMMRNHGFEGLEIAPALAFPKEADPFHPSDDAVRSFRNDLASFGLEAISMQSLLFGQTGARLFGNAAEVAAFEQAIGRAIGLAERLAIPNLVLGSPASRSYPKDMPVTEVEIRAADLFCRLGDRAVAAGTVIAIEPNPAAYGTNFLNRVDAVVDFVVQLNHPGITVNFDIGALYMNGEEDRAAELFAKAAGRVSHVHVSEPHLDPAPADCARTAAISDALLAQGYDHWFSIEMRRPDADPLGTLAGCLERAALAIRARGQSNA